MTNLITLQSRAAFQGMFINDEVDRFGSFFEGKNASDLIAGFMVLFTIVMIIGRLATSPQATMLADLAQAVTFSSKLLVIVVRAMAWGVLGI